MRKLILMPLLLVSLGLASCDEADQQQSSGGETDSQQAQGVEKPAAPKPLLAEKAFMEKQWTVNDMNGVAVSENSNVTVYFEQTGSIWGRASCNRYRTTYKLDGDAIIIENTVGSTRMMCPGDLTAQEAKFLELIPGRKSVTVGNDGKTLTLTGEDGATLRMHFEEQVQNPLVRSMSEPAPNAAE